MYACAAKQSNSCAFLAPTGLSIETSPRFITQGNSYIWTEACRAPYQLLLTQRYEGFIYSFNCFLHHTKHIFPIFTGTIKPDTSHTESPHLQHMWKYISNDIICHSDSVTVLFDLKTQRETMKGIYCYTLLLRRSLFGNW